MKDATDMSGLSISAQQTMFSRFDRAASAARCFTLALVALPGLCSGIDLAQRIASDANALNADLFPSERVQLTDAIIDQIADNAAIAHLAQVVGFQSNGSDGQHHFTDCKTYPGDKSWPSTAVWNDIDTLINGSMIKTKPIASLCYNSQWGIKDPVGCSTLVSNFQKFSTHEEDPTSIMWPLFQGKTCMASNVTSSDGTCTLGSYPEYSVNVSNTAHIQVAVNVARNLNIRLVIKNTGHCYLGKSTGAGSISIWTHNLKDLQYLPGFELDGYKGPAFKVGAGVTATEMYHAAESQNLTILGSIAPSVGYAGGYIQGGGHTPLSGLHGMGADAALAFQVVTADGRFVTASATSNPDLFWALRGGGGSTFGVVTSVIVKAYPQTDVSVSSWVLGNSTDGTQVVSRDNFFQALRIFWEMFPAMTSARTYSFFFIFNKDGQLSMDMRNFFAPTHTPKSLDTLLAPFFAAVKELGVPFVQAQNTTYHPTFLPAYMQAWGSNNFPMGTATSIPGNRLLPRSLWGNAANFERLWNTTVAHIEAGRHFGVYHQAPGNPQGVDNAVSSAWRNCQSFFITHSPGFAENANSSTVREANRVLVEDNLGPWRKLAPASDGGGSYLNEAAVDEPLWKEDFYGEQYGRLVELKTKYDPTGVFYATTGIESDKWELRGEDMGVTTQNGRLCRV